MTTNPNEKDPWLGGEAPERPKQPAPASTAAQESDAEAESSYTGSQQVETELLRLFVAVTLPRDVRESMAELGTRLERPLRESVRWTPVDNIHVTLQFLGDTEPDQVPVLISTLSETAANSSPMSIAAGKTGAFPLFRNPKILWIGFDGEVHRLEQLQGRVEGTLARLGYEPERRKFTPHASVGRTLRGLFAKEAADLGFSWKRLVGPRHHERFMVESFTLYRSRLQKGGPVYEVVHEFRLGG